MFYLHYNSFSILSYYQLKMNLFLRFVPITKMKRFNFGQKVKHFEEDSYRKANGQESLLTYTGERRGLGRRVELAQKYRAQP